MRHSRWLFFLAWWPEFTSSWGEDWWAPSSSTGQSGPPPPPDHRAEHFARGDGRLAHSSLGQRGSNSHETSNWHYHQRAPAHMFAGDGHGTEVGLRGASKEVIIPSYVNWPRVYLLNFSKKEPSNILSSSRNNSSSELCVYTTYRRLNSGK